MGKHRGFIELQVVGILDMVLRVFSRFQGTDMDGILRGDETEGQWETEQ